MPRKNSIQPPDHDDHRKECPEDSDGIHEWTRTRIGEAKDGTVFVKWECNRCGITFTDNIT